ncbi:hypothetical protein AK88_01737 [Plasmodium fragile]|uniref:Major facilitator superfamily (MFS) profile domain-containing protein n=1 Tax=Plasmodium fragile TaxID=5857 RepID=A0A0D9QPF7_PLAFR|nr:uncharacterized protein AK88_01737 [Plasmodium fragile]KJP88657.1 hypothetical protein AK88_01737 [Plasmodium fragile]
MKEDIAKLKYGQSVPNDLKVSKWTALVLYSVVSALATFVHAGFSSWQPIIYKSGAFSELCSPTDEMREFKVDANISYMTCGNRDVAVNNLFTLSFFVHFFLSSSVSGFVLDTFGEKVCFVSGQIILAGAFLSLAVLKFSYVWYLFFLMLGVSADLCFIPLLKISKYFPGKESLIFGILGAARSTGFAIALLLKYAFFYAYNFKENEFYILCIVYLCVCSLYSFLVGIFIVPGKNTEHSELNSELATGSSNPEKKRNISVMNEMDRMESADKKLYDNEPCCKFSDKIKTLWNHPQKWEYLITLFICSSSMIRFDYFIKTNRSILIWKDYDLTTIFSLSTIMSFLPTPLFGYLAGKFGSIYSILTNNVFVFLTYILILFDGYIFRLMAIILFFFYISFVFSCFYCYVDEKYSKEHFGKLCGIMFAVSALCLIINFYLTYLTDVVYMYLGEKKHFPVTYGLNVLGVVTLLCCLYLKIKEKKK